MTNNIPSIRHLPEHFINLIAAGEVVERPAAALKELIENSLDAGATSIEIFLEDGGKTKIEVRDNGRGMNADELPLAVSRHCTSKIDFKENENLKALDILERIKQLGFRGEALPSIASSARVTILSRTKEDDIGWKLSINGGVQEEVAPSASPFGTTVTVEDLFFSTPARRKFLKSDRVEAQACENVARRLAFCAPQCAIRFNKDGRDVFSYPIQTIDERASSVLETNLSDLASIEVESHGYKLRAWLGNPAHSRATSAAQYFSVNSRAVTDTLLRTVLRVAYRPYIEKGRFAVAGVHFDLPSEEVDVNVHPSKNEVRFRNEPHVRGFLIKYLSEALNKGVQFAPAYRGVEQQLADLNSVKVEQDLNDALDREATQSTMAFEASFAHTQHQLMTTEEHKDTSGKSSVGALGVPIMQLFDTYILSRNEAGNLIVTDQHAAHERLTIERFKKQFKEKKVRAQTLLMPRVIEVGSSKTQLLESCAEELDQLGIILEKFDNQRLLVRAVPAMIDPAHIESLLKDLADEISEHDEVNFSELLGIQERLEAIFARIACHGSIRAGRRLKFEEMDALLRMMEQEPASSTCPHGRPTWHVYTQHDFEKLFGRLQ